jgi:hypothetical protein
MDAGSREITVMPILFGSGGPMALVHHHNTPRTAALGPASRCIPRPGRAKAVLTYAGTRPLLVRYSFRFGARPSQCGHEKARSERADSSVQRDATTFTGNGYFNKPSSSLMYFARTFVSWYSSAAAFN